MNLYEATSNDKRRHLVRPNAENALTSPSGGSQPNIFCTSFLNVVPGEAEAIPKTLSVQSVKIKREVLEDRYDKELFILVTVRPDQSTTILTLQSVAANRSRKNATIISVQWVTIGMFRTVQA